MLSLEDERQIGAVILRYASGIDRRDWSLLRSCFTEDVQADYGDFGRWTDAEQIVAFMREAHMALGPTLHRITNVVIDGEGAGARARSYVDALLLPADKGGQARRGVGYYDDELVKGSTGWRIKRRQFTAVQLI